MSRDVNSKYWNEELETLPREELEKRQLEDLKEIVQFAYDHAPYYKRSFDEAGVKPSDIKALSDIQKFPFIDKTTQRDTQGVGSFLGGTCCGSRRGCGVYLHVLRLHRSSYYESVYQTGFR